MTQLRIAVLGAGAIGGTVAGLLHRTGLRTTLIARGEHLNRIQSDGLWLRTPRWQAHLDIPVTDTVPPDIDVLLLAVKSHQTRAAIGELPRKIPIVCLQNGIGNEPIVHSLGHPTIGAMVWVPAVHLEPGEVRCHGHPIPGAIDVGVYPNGSGPLAEAVSAALSLAGFESRVSDDIMSLKRAKLLTNLGNGLQAACGEVPRDLWEMMVDEAQAIFAAHDLPVAPLEAVTQRVQIESAPIDGIERPGGSTWQSLQRGRQPETYALHRPLMELSRQARLSSPLIRRTTAVTLSLEAPEAWSIEDLRAALTGSEYSRFDIFVMPGLEAVRQRHGMYVVGDDDDGVAGDLLRAFVRDLPQLSAKTARVVLNLSSDRLSVHVSKSGLSHELSGRLVTELHGGRTFGLPVANALSARFVVTNTFDGRCVRCRYHAGEFAEATELDPPLSGLSIDLTLDRTLIQGRFNPDTASAWLTDLAAENPTLTITFNGDPIP